MGMSIDESLEWLISRKEHYEMDDNCQELAQALELAISVMGKYQRIQEIMNELNGNFYGSYLKDRQVLEKIYEVLEDGRS